SLTRLSLSLSLWRLSAERALLALSRVTRGSLVLEVGSGVTRSCARGLNVEGFRRGSIDFEALGSLRPTGCLALMGAHASTDERFRSPYAESDSGEWRGAWN